MYYIITILSFVKLISSFNYRLVFQYLLPGMDSRTNSGYI